MAWLRLYDDILDDPKIQLLSDRDFRMLINLWCVTKRHDGIIPENMKILTFTLRMTETKICEGIQTLVETGLIERTRPGWEPHNWKGRQYESDVSTDRVKRFRKRRRNVDETFHETPPEPERNVSETANETAPETETETETETSNPTSLRSVGTRARDETFHETFPKRAVKGTRWPADAEIPDAWLSEAAAGRAKHQLPPIDLRLEATRFANYWASKAGGNATHVDWRKTWINWVLNANGKQKNGDGRHEKSRGHSAFLEGAFLSAQDDPLGNAGGEPG